MVNVTDIAAGPPRFVRSVRSASSTIKVASQYVAHVRGCSDRLDERSASIVTGGTNARRRRRVADSRAAVQQRVDLCPEIPEVRRVERRRDLDCLPDAARQAQLFYNHAADFWNLGAQIDALWTPARESSLRVGDGHFVPPVTIGADSFSSRSLHQSTNVARTIDCHLMVETPERHFEQIAAAAAIRSPFTMRPSVTSPRPAAAAATTRPRLRGWRSTPRRHPSRSPKPARTPTSSYA